MPIGRSGIVGVILNGATSGQRLNASYAWYDAAEPDLSPTAIAGPPAIGPVGGPADGPNLLEWRETGFPFGSEQSKITYSGTLPPGVGIVQKEVRPESPPGVNPWPVGVLAEWAWAGVPTTPGVYNVTVAPSSHAGSAGYPGADFTWTISLAGGCPLITIEPDTIDLEFVGQPIDLTLTAEDGVAPYTWDVAFGALPAGLALSGGGALTGAPTTAGDYTFTIRATDDNGCQGARVYALSIVDPDPIVVFPLDPDLPPGARDQTYVQIFTAEGGVGEPYVFTIEDSESELPDGLALDEDGTLAGLPTVAGLFVFTVRAADVALNFGEREYTLQITGLRIMINEGGEGGYIDKTREVAAADLELGLNRQATGEIEFGDGYLPGRGVDLLIYARDGITEIFGGIVLSRRVGGMTPSSPANRTRADLVDYSIYFDDADPITIVSAVSQDLEDVIASIVTQSLDVYGITYDEAATGHTVPPIEWAAITVADAFKRITDATGVVFRVDPLKALKVFTPLDDPAPVTITDANINAFDLEWSDPSGLAKNQVVLMCGPTGDGIATQEWEVDSGEIEWEVDIQAVLGNAEPARRANAYLSPVDATNFSAGDTIGAGASTYTFRASLVGDVAGEVLIGASVEDSIDNLNAAINLAGGGVYAPSTAANADVSSYIRNPGQIEVDALTVGAAGNAITVTSSHEAIAFWYGEGGIARGTLQLGADATGAAGWTQGYILEDGAVARPIGTVPGTAPYLWDVTDGRGTISVDLGPAPADGTLLELKYLAVFPFPAIAPPGGASPPRTFRENHPEIGEYAAGLALAAQILLRESAERRELEVFTDVDGFTPGQALDVNTAHRYDIDATFLVATVRIKLVNAELWEYSITCQQSDEYAGTYVDQWKSLTAGGGSAAAPATLEAGGAIGAGDIYSDGRQSFGADQSMGGHKLTSLEDPEAAQDAATRAYVDDAVGGGALILTGVHGSRPAAATDGRLYLPDDGYSVARDSGSIWAPWGPIFPFTTPVDTGYAWLNQGSSTLATTKDALVLVGAGVGNTANLVGRVKTAPGTPYTITAYIVGLPIFKNNHSWGLMLRQSGAGTGQNRIRVLGLAQLVASATAPGPAVIVWGRVNATTGFADFPYSNPVIESIRWFRITDNGTNLTYYVSADGQTWTQIYTEARTAYLLQGPDQVGFFVDTQNTATPNLDNVISVLSWKQ